MYCIPTLGFAVLNAFDSADTLVANLVTHPLFDYQKVFDFSQPKSLYYLFLFCYIAIPAFNPAIFQRIAMAKNTTQIKYSFIIAGFACVLIILIIYWISTILLFSKTDIASPSEVGKYIIFDYSYVGLRGLTLAGIMAMVMSTADSYVNATSVLIVHDFCKPLKINFIRDELNFSRLVSLFIGIFSMLLAMRSGSLLELFMFTSSFYMPIVTIPFIMSIFGFRSSSKSVLLAMGAGFITVILWEFLFKIKVIDSIVPGMLVNLIVLMGSHYLLKQPGGWVGIKDKTELIKIRKARKRLLEQLWLDIKSFNLIEVYKNNYPKGDGLISILGFYVMLSVFATTNLLPEEYRLQHLDILDVLYPIAVSSSAILISYPLWLWNWKESRFVGVFWNLIMFWVLICFTFLTVLIGRFSEMQLIVFMMNIVIISSLGKWQWSLFNFIAGIVLVSVCYTNYYPGHLDNVEFVSSQFKIFYLLILY